MESTNSGRKGESAAAAFLIKSGYDIIAMNYHSKFGEIDIIAQNDEYIVFVEVKSRSDNAMYSGAEAVTKKKQRRIIATALNYLKYNGIERQPRFDIVEVGIKSNVIFKKWEVNHIENAFDLEDGSNAIF